jgi:uncharacterized OsmC-like protein
VSAVAHSFTIEVEQVDGFEFRVRFDKPQYAEVQLDEPEPLGRDGAPNAVRLLAAAIGNCLAASLVFCAKRQGAQLTHVRAKVDLDLVRDEAKRLRVGRVAVTLEAPDADARTIAACVPLFEEFCTVTQSVRQGIAVDVALVQQSADDDASAVPATRPS